MRIKGLEVLFSALIGGLVSGCIFPCEPGGGCQLQCPQGLGGQCSDDGLCLCAVSKRGSGAWGQEEDPCRAPRVGEIRINEVHIASAGDDREFVELVNLAASNVSLRGMVLRSNRGNNMVDRVRFGPGCLDSGTALVVFEDTETSARPRRADQLTLVVRPFGFPNSDDFRFELLDADGELLDLFAGSGAQIIRGMSLNRSPDRIGGRIDLHSRQAAGIKSSPGRCPNGGTYGQRCENGDANAVHCPAPAVGDVSINEIMIDGEPQESEEFVEVVNLSSHPIDLSGATLFSNRGDGFARRIVFATACMAPHSAVAMYQALDQWQWSRPNFGNLSVESFQFQFANQREFHFRLTGIGGELLDEAQGPARLIRPGVSVNRAPDLEGRSWVAHEDISSLVASPARCPNLAYYEDGCALPPPSIPVPPHVRELIFDPDAGGSEGI